VADELAWAALLDERLAPARVVNLGLIGAGPEQYARVLERFGLAFGPRVVLFCLFPANDVVDARLFDEWLAAGAPGNYDVWRFHGGGASALERSTLFHLAREALRGRRAGRGFAPRTITLVDGSRLRLAPNVLAASSAGAQRGHPDFERVWGSIARAQNLAGGIGARFVVVLFPSKEEVYLGAMDEPCPKPTRAFRRALADAGAEVLDLTPALQEATKRGQALFFEVDGHPNAAGYAVIAGAVEAFLRER